MDGTQHPTGRSQLRDHRLLALLLPVVGVIGREPLVGRPAHGAAQRLAVLVPDILAEIVVDEGIAVLAEHRQARRKPLGHGELQVSPPVQATVVAGGHRGLAAQLAAGLARMQHYRAADRVLAIERALRPAQNFHAIQRRDIEQRSDRLADVDAVEVDTDHRVFRDREVGAAQSAHAHQRAVVTAGIGHDDQVGGHLAEVRDVGDAELLDVACAECSDRYRHHLQVFLAPPRGDHDFLDLPLRRRRRAILCQRARPVHGAERGDADGEREGPAGESRRCRLREVRVQADG